MRFSFNKLNIYRPSLALIILSWVSFNFNIIFLNYHVSIIETFLFLITIIFAEITISKLSNNKFSLLFVLNIFLLLFGYLITLNFSHLLNYLFESSFRGRTIFFPLFFILNISTILVKKPNYKFVNIFLFIFIISNISYNLIINANSNANADKYVFLNKNVTFSAENKNKPILLLILDEYHSPDDLFRVTKDSSIYNFSSTLIKNGWHINNSFYSNEIRTVRSLSSLFNYNLSSDSNFIIQGENIYPKLFTRNLLYLDLLNKGIKIVNWSIFNFGPEKPLYFVVNPDISNILDRILENTALNIVLRNTNNLKFFGFKNNYYPTTLHNIKILNNLKDSLVKIKSNTFIYSHLIMPHPPFDHPNFFGPKKINLQNYIDYWNFTNSLVQNDLIELARANNIKIILTGDHGFRYDERLNKNKTFLALYGFETLNINEIKTVQDIGSLINSNF
jgi:hypothetical protein